MIWPRAILHVDMDTFFVSVERRNDPSLNGKPVIVGGGPGGEMRRGVVAACSYETRVFGVHSAMPLAQAMRLCPQAILIPVGRSDYGAATAEVRAVLGTFTDQFEMASPDEAYVDLAGTELLHGTPITAASKLRGAIAGETGLPVSIGLGTSKTVAKIASKLSKPHGLFAVLPGGERAMLRPLPIRRMPGLGPKTGEALARRNIETLGDLADAGEERLTDWFGEHGASLWRRSIGDCRSEIHPVSERLQISTEETFGIDVGDAATLHTELGRMAMKLGAGLRRKGQRAGTIKLKLRYPDFTTLTRQAPLDPPTDDDTRILKAGRGLFEKAWDHKTPIRLIGIGVSGFTDLVQGDMFQSAGDEKQKRLMQTLDKIRGTAGKDKMIWGAAMRKQPADPPVTPTKPGSKPT